MARIRGRAGYKPQAYNKTEVFRWLKTLPLAPEFHPTLEEFQDPIAYIHKIEKEASLYGICKIIPPVSLPSRKNTILELNNSFLARYASPEGELRPAFATRVQQVGFCPRKDQPVIKSVRESGETYTLSEFESKAKAFEKNHFKKSSIIKGVLSPLELETLYWDAQADKAIDVEYGNDMPGSAFVELNKRRVREGLTENLNVGDTEWNMRGVARAKGCPLRYIKDDVPGVTSPMVYMGMLFSWFAWHVEDHDLHSLNYMHMGDGKTWYGVPKDAAIAFEEVIRNQGYGGQKNPITTYATLAQKNTVMSPEVILNAGIPCCRLVQNAGEFVVTFPRAYHSGFSHGFNCAEASNIATPEWLRYASEAAIRRAAVKFPPLVAHVQLLYDLAMSFSSRVPMGVEPRSLRLKEKKKDDGEYLVKELYMQDVMHNTNLLHSLGKRSPAILLPRDFIEGKFPKLRDGNTIPLYSKHIDFSCTATSKKQKIFTEEKVPAQCERLANTGFFSCVTCGVLCFACAAIIRPSRVAVDYLMSADCGNTGGRMAATEIRQPASCSRPPKDTSSLSLLALTYGDATDSETESREVSPVYGLDSDDSRSSRSLSFPVVSPTESANSQSTHGNQKASFKDKDYPTAGSTFECETNKFLMESTGSDGSSIPCMVLPHVTASSASVANHTESAIGSALVPVQDRGTLFPQNFDEDFSRSHVFCLQHAFEVEQKLCAHGGVHMLLLCHPDYPKFQAGTKLMADDVGADHLSRNIAFRTVTEEDKESIKSAINSKGSIHGNADWAGKLGVNLIYSAKLSHSPFYSEQIPYNSVLYKAFGRSPSADISAIPKLDQKKTVVVGRWCGKLWMYNQVHHLLAERVQEEQEPVNVSQTLAKQQVQEPNVMPENRSKSKTVDLSSESSKATWKRKIVAGIEPTSRGKSLKVEGSVRPTDNEQVKVSQTLTKQLLPERVAMPEESSKSQTIDLSSESSKATLKRKSMADIEPTSRGKSPEVEESVKATDDAPKSKCIIQYKRTFRNKLKEKVIQEETPRPEKKHDQGAEQVDVNVKEDEGGPSTRLRQRTRKQLAKNDLELVMDKVVARSSSKKLACTKRAKRNLGIRASAVKRTKKSEETEYASKIEGCTMNFGSKQELVQHEKNICSVEGCRKNFVSHKYLLQHQKVHLDERPLICPWEGCMKTFKWAWARTEHIRVHTGDRPYTCGETSCGKTFRFVSDFSRHKRKTGHSGKVEESTKKGKTKTK